MCTKYILLAFSVLFALSSSVSAATRLGLHVTAEELAIWRARMTDTVGTINGFTYQSIYQNRLKALADAFLSTQSGDGLWAGNTTTSCQPPESSGFGPGRSSGRYMANAAFLFLLTDTTSYATGVRANLLSMAGNPNLDFTNTTKWCNPGYQNGVELHPWMVRMFLAYDYLKAANYGGLSAGERTTIEVWLKGMATWWFASFKSGSMGGFYSYNLFSNPLDTSCLSNCTASGAPWYFGGHATAGASENVFNTTATGAVLLGMLAGVMTNDATMIADAKRWITGYISTAHNYIGVVAQFRRWQDGPCAPACGVGSAWGHAGGMTGSIVLAIDVLARTGDTALYTHSAANTVPGSPAGTVSMFVHLRKFARMANSTEPIYTYSGGLQNTEITWDGDVGQLGNYYDFSLMPANLYYQNAEISTAMRRNTLGSNAPSAPSGCYDSQFGGCFTGANGVWWPDLPFMYGNMEGVVNPYVAGTPPVVTISTPTSAPTFSTSTTPLPVAGSASDTDGTLTTLQLTCSPACGAPPNTGTLSAWSFSVPLAGGDNIITVTATDNTAQTGQDQLTVTYTVPVAATMIPAFIFTDFYMH